ncbi:MAG: cytochrome c [Saprospiraceae bacterium]
MKKLALIIFAFGFIFYACGGGEETSSTNNQEVAEKSAPNGEKLYQQANCVTCHGAFGEPVLAGAGDLRNPELTLAQRIETITNGSKANATMIAFKDTYSEAEIKAIAEYTMGFVE